MKNRPINTVLFEADGFDLMVSRVKPEQAQKLARPILQVMADAYERQLELDSSVLPIGSSQDYFAAQNPQLVRAQQERMEAYMQAGSSYWVANLGRYSTSPNDIVGVAKTSPSRPTMLHRMRLLKPNCYVNDVAVIAPRRGIGSALLRVALDDYNRSLSAVAADVVPGSEPFFEAAGMTPVNPQPDEFAPLEIGGVPLHEQMTRYGTQFSGMVKLDLMHHNAWLAEPVFSSQ